MLGLIHRAKDGPGLLREWLLRLRPQLITVEVSRYALTFRRTHGEAYKNMIEKASEDLRLRGVKIDERARERLLSFFDIPYEFSVCEEYTSTHGGHLFPVDMGLFSAIYLRQIQRQIERSDLEPLLTDGAAYEEEREKTKARLFFEKGIRTFEYTAEMAQRDRLMARRIRSLARSLNPKTTVHVCGWQHLADPFRAFEGLMPRKVFVYGGPVCL